MNNHFEQIDLAKLAEEYWDRLIAKPRTDSKNIFDRLNDAIGHSSFNALLKAKKDFLNSLNDEKFLKAIIIGKPDELEKYAQKVDNTLFWDEKKSESTPFGKKVLKIFHYDGFRASKRLGFWVAESLKIKSCPYCNAQYIINTNEKVYHTFDHFFPKAIYPYLSVSFYNLIPACNTCNQTKSNKLTSLTTHWHPYFGDDLMSKFQFEIEPKSCVDFALDKYKTDAILKIQTKSQSNPMVKTHIETFNLEDQYKVHTDIAAETIWKSMVYVNSYKTELKNLFAAIGLTEPEIKRIIIGNYSEPEDVHKRPLSKLTSDLAKDLRLI